MNLEEAVKRWKKIDLEKVATRSLKRLEAEIIDLNRQQLQEGIDSDNSPLPEYANDDYFQAKKAEGKATAGRRYNLFLEGDFYGGFKITYQGDDAIIDSTDEKRDRLVQLTSEAIFGLTDESMQKFIEDQFEPVFIEELIKEMGI